VNATSNFGAGRPDFAGTAHAISTSYGYKSTIRNDPATAAPWTKARVNSAEFGMEVA
jgi:hypothetical protein